MDPTETTLYPVILPVPDCDQSATDGNRSVA